MMPPQSHIHDDLATERYLTERKALAGRITLRQIKEYCLCMQHDETLVNILLRMLDEPDRRTADNAAWVLTHADNGVCRHLSSRFAELAEKAIHTEDETLRRLLLSLLWRLPFPDSPHVGLLNFCLTEMMSCRQPYGVRSLCMKIAYETGLPIPELRTEIALSLDMMEPDLLPPSLRCVRKNILKRLRTRKSLRS